MKAIVKRSFIHGEVIHDKGARIDIPEGQFADWQSVGLVDAEPEDAPASADPADAAATRKSKPAKPE